MRVLIVEDEYITRNFLTSIIDWKVNEMELVGVAKDGIEALNLINREKIDILITDLKMPKMDGNKLIKQLKSREFEGKIIVLSNYDDFNLVKESMKNGAFEYLLKVTINKKELLDVLNKAKEELIKDNKLIKNENILEISKEKLIVNEYLEKYLKGNNSLKLDDRLKQKYLTDYVFVYLRILSTSIDNIDKEHKITKFIANVISTCALYINSELLTLINLNRSEYSIIIKSNKNTQDINILISNIARNVKQYLDVDFEKIVHKECESLKDAIDVINYEREVSEYSVSSKIIVCRPEIKKIVKYINENIEKKLSLDLLSKIVNMNESYLSRIFKEELDVTISEYIKNTRLEKSKELLKKENFRVKDAALSVGIHDQLYFSRLFAKKFNITPSEYREKYFK
ncbi:response regulator transcription factor [Romboutsia lituseburensis]|nr:response regulator [Romboutsia lituseburensis]MCR8744037.1 response regulator [Romboutsia lituseburensis]